MKDKVFIQIEGKLRTDKNIVIERLSETDEKIRVLQKILYDKKMRSEALKSRRAENASFGKSMPLKDAEEVKAHEKVEVFGGFKVSDFCLPPRYKPITRRLPPITVENMEPQVVTDKNMLRIRVDQAKKTVAAEKISALITRKENAKKKAEEKAKRGIRNFPNISVPVSMLPNRYVRAELPCTIEHGISGHYLSWACPLSQLDYDYYLPIFFDGLQCTENPSRFLARQGVEDLLIGGKDTPERICSAIPKLVRPLRNALNKFDIDILLGVLKAIQQLVLSGKNVGLTLMKYSKQFLSPIALFMDDNKNIGDSIDYAQRKGNDVGEEVRKTLELMEENGGPDAFQTIKFSVPLYQSCVRAPDSHHNKKDNDKKKKKRT